MSRALPIALTALALALAVAGVFGLAGPWWACLAAAVGILLFVLITDFEGSNDGQSRDGRAGSGTRRG